MPLKLVLIAPTLLKKHSQHPIVQSESRITITISWEHSCIWKHSQHFWLSVQSAFLSTLVSVWEQGQHFQGTTINVSGEHGQYYLGTQSVFFRMHRIFQGAHHYLTICSLLKVSLVLSALQAGNKGTQACITAATAVSGIIADLDTTIMFATAGTLNAENNETFADHRSGGSGRFKRCFLEA